MKKQAATGTALVLSFFLLAGSSPLHANIKEGPAEDQLLEIQKKLDDLKQGQETLIEGIKQLSEEHKQLRYFEHRH